MSYQPRTYRQLVQHADLVTFQVGIMETDLQIAAASELREEALAAIREARRQLTNHGAAHPEFFASLTPLAMPAACPEVPRRMYAAAATAGVGPMAAVAGAVAQYVGEALREHSPEVIVENGGDIYLATSAPRAVAIHAGNSPLTGRLGLSLPAGSRLGVCTSSGTVGHSLSFGKADAALVAAEDAALADAVASGLGNRVQGPADVADVLEWVQTVPGVLYALVIVDETLGAWGQFELVKV
jgi:ApbE superfamily uncharacterized protein (UPF0280 family)